MIALRLHIISLLVIALYAHRPLYSQLPLHSQWDVLVVPDSKGFYESFFSLSDSLMRAEIGSFSFTGSLVGLAGKAELAEFDVLSQTVYTITLGSDDVKVHIARSPFISSAHHLSYYGPYGYVYKIDGRNFWGFDGSVPDMRLYFVNAYFGEQMVSVPQSAKNDIYEPNFCFRPRLFHPLECFTRVFRSADGRRLYVYMLNSRIPSLYEVCWIFIDGKYAGRIVDYAY